MKLAYMYATPEVGPHRVTALRGEPSRSLAAIRAAGYTGVEFLVRDPAALDAAALQRAVQQEGLDVPAVCTGEVYGEDLLSFADPDPGVRQQAIARMRSSMALAARFGASVNVGRLRGRYQDGVAPGQTLDWIREALRACVQAHPTVRIVMEPVNRQYANCLTGTADMLAFVADLDLPTVGIMLDMVHILVEEEDLPASLKAAQAGGRWWHFHVSDSERLPLGDGHYDTGAVIAALRAVAYDAYVTVETFQIPDGPYALRQSFATLSPYFPT